MRTKSDAAKNHIVKLLNEAYPHVKNSEIENSAQRRLITMPAGFPVWTEEFMFAPPRRWRFDYAVPSILCAVELDGGTFQSTRTGHASGVGLRNWREKNNAAMSLGWRVWHYAPDEVIKAGRKSNEGMDPIPSQRMN